MGSTITNCGRHGISILGLFFETLLGKHRVTSLDACLHFIREVGHETYTEVGITFLNSIEDVTVADVLNSMGVTNPKFRKALTKILKTKDKFELKKLCYKNNLELLIESDYFKTRLTKVYKATNEYYHIHKFDKDEDGEDIKMKDKMFAFCYHHGDHYSKEMSEIQHIIHEVVFGYYWYEKDYVPKTKTFEESSEELVKTIDRYSLLLCDTDSNISTVEDQTNYVMEEYGGLLTNYDVEDLKWTQSIATATFLVMCYVDFGAERYKAHRGIPIDLAHYFDIKNEFAYKDFAITDRKKNYIGDIKVIEGAVLPKKKYDIKGLSFKKSGFNENIGKFAADLCRSNVMVNRSPKTVLTELDRFSDLLERQLSTNKAIDYFTTLKLNTMVSSIQKSESKYKITDLWNISGNGNLLSIPCGFYAIPITVHNDIYRTNYSLGKAMYKRLFSVKYCTVIMKEITALYENHIDTIKYLMEDYDTFALNYSKERGCTCVEEVILKSLNVDKPDDYVNELGEVIFNSIEDIKFFNEDKVMKSAENNEVIYNLCNVLFDSIKDTPDDLERRIAQLKLYINDIRNSMNQYVVDLILINKKEILATGNIAYKEIIDREGKKMIVKSFNSKLTKLNKYYTKIALPRTMVIIPQEILELVNKSVVLSQADNLVSQLSKSVHLITAQGIGNIVSNVVDGF